MLINMRNQMTGEENMAKYRDTILAIINRTVSEIPIAADILKIGNSAFRNCANLNSVYLPNCTRLDNNAFYSCTGITNISLPSVTSIDTYAFYGNTALVSVSLPICTSLAANIFQGCISLVDVEFPEVTSAGAWCFQSCTNLETLSFPKVTIIRNNFCNGCTKLKRVSIPKVSRIENNAFVSTSVLEVVDLSLGTAVATLENVNAFTRIPSTCKIIVPDDLVSSYKTANNWSTYADLIISRSDAIQGEIISS